VRPCRCRRCRNLRAIPRAIRSGRNRRSIRIRTRASRVVILCDTALSVDHVGSTSIPGLAANPIIDIDLVVPNSADESAYVPQLEPAGYLLIIREPDWHEHRCLKGPDTNINLHVFSPGSPELHRHTVFRDWLRTHSDDRNLYARTKLDLASQEWSDTRGYTEAKDDVIDAIYLRAFGVA